MLDMFVHLQLCICVCMYIRVVYTLLLCTFLVCKCMHMLLILHNTLRKNQAWEQVFGVDVAASQDIDR